MFPFRFVYRRVYKRKQWRVRSKGESCLEAKLRLLEPGGGGDAAGGERARGAFAFLGLLAGTALFLPFRAA